MLQEIEYEYLDKEEKYFYMIVSCKKLDTILKYCVNVLKETNPISVNYYSTLTTDAATYVNTAIINSAKIHNINSYQEIDISEEIIGYLEDCLTQYKNSLKSLVRLMKKQNLLGELLMAEKSNYVVVLIKKVNSFLNMLENVFFSSFSVFIMYQLLNHVVTVLFPVTKNILTVLRIFMVTRLTLKYY